MRHNILVILITVAWIVGFHVCFGDSPKLSITRSNANMILTWPQTSGSWQLFETQGLDYYSTSNGVPYKKVYPRTFAPNSSYSTNGANILVVYPTDFSATTAFFLLHTNNPPPKGVNGWFNCCNAINNTSDFTNLVNLMVNDGMVKNGWNWLLFDVGPEPAPAYDSPFPLVTNSTPYPALTNATGWLDFDAGAFPEGAKWLIAYAHTNGVKIILYAFNSPGGGTGSYVGSNYVQRAQPGIYGDTYYYAWLANAITNWGLDGIKDDANRDGIARYTNAVLQAKVIADCSAVTGKSFYVNTPCIRGYETWFNGLYNSWRIGTYPYGDVNNFPAYYNWLDIAPFGLTQPNSFNDFDEMYQRADFIVLSGNPLFRNELATMTMANAPLLSGQVPTQQRIFPAQEGWFYDFYDNPLINSIQADFTSSMQKVSSNNLAVVYSKKLADGTFAFVLQNRASTNQTISISLTNLYPLVSTPVFTIHDIFRNAPTVLATNNYTVSVAANYLEWFKVIPGVEQQFAAGTNNLTYYAWSTNSFVYCGETVQVNNYNNGTGGPFPLTGSWPFPATNQTGIVMPTAGTNALTWFIGGVGTTFSATLGAQFANNWFKVLGDTTVLWSGNVLSGTVTNIAVSVAGYNNLTITYTNNNYQGATATSIGLIGDPLLVCSSQTAIDPKTGLSKMVSLQVGSTNY